MKSVFIYTLFFLFISAEFFSQGSARAFIKIDTSRIRIGEQAQLEIILGYDANKINKKIIFPEIADTLRKEIDVISKSKIEAYDTKAGSSTLQFRQKITITSFDSGFWVIPPFVFFVEGDTLPIAETEALVLEVKTVPTDTAETSLRDIKSIFEEKWTWKDWLPTIYWSLAILATLAAIIMIAIYFNNKRKRKPIVEKEIFKEPPHITALKELEKIKNDKIWTTGNYKEYYTSIIDVLRNYIEGRFKIHAMELTTDEIIQIFRTQVIDSESKAKLKMVLELADFVKFAKVIPIEAENELTLSAAYDFVNGTRRDEVKPLDLELFDHQENKKLETENQKKYLPPQN